MGYSFEEIGMTRADILAALDAMPDQDVSPSSWSGKVYLMDPRDGMLWDIMPPQGRAVSPDDFAVLCATCHRLIHTLKRPDDLKGLRRLRKR